MLTARAAIAAAAAVLPGDTPRLDAEVLAAHLLGVDRSALLLRHLDEPLDADGWAALVGRRLGHEPVAHILGEREFWSLTFRVTPATLIPRPDSETLIEAALARTPRDAARRILDLGTGSGCLLLAALSEYGQATGVGVDASAEAAAVAADNAARLGLAARAEIIVGGWDARAGERFDLVFSNPPYVESDAELSPEVRDHEPHTALFAGPDGLDDYRRIVPLLPRYLAPGGWAHLEIGPTQADVVSALGREAGLTSELTCDLAGRPRCLSFRVR
ncbi:MAG: peptide chain release factor N(5)-glutamine methyltransferase [Alphaproteobacteria bacterium]|nr:peptide chain release factor N(5)-glutamine methyltransferase [Alphaproteobacteria bacterium]